MISKHLFYGLIKHLLKYYTFIVDQLRCYYGYLFIFIINHDIFVLFRPNLLQNKTCQFCSYVINMFR